MKEENDLKERTKQLALRIIRLFGSLPKSTEAQVLGKQLLRSGTSVGADYCEAHRGRSKAEFIAKCGDSLRELEASAYWLELLVDAEIVASSKLHPLRTECDELTAIFVTIIKPARDGKYLPFFLLHSSFKLHRPVPTRKRPSASGSSTTTLLRASSTCPKISSTTPPPLALCCF